MNADQEITANSSNTIQQEEQPPLNELLGNIHELNCVDDDVVRAIPSEGVEKTNTSVSSTKKRSENSSSSSSFSAFDDEHIRLKAINDTEILLPPPLVDYDDNRNNSFPKEKTVLSCVIEEHQEQESDEEKENQVDNLIDYEKCRKDDYGITLPQSHVPTEFKATKNAYGMPTCYTLDKRLEEIFSRVNDDDDDIGKGEEEEERIEFLFKVKPKQLRRRKSMTDSSSRDSTVTEFRRHQSHDVTASRRVGGLSSSKTGVISAMMKKSRRRSNEDDSIVAPTARSSATEEYATTFIPIIPECVGVPMMRKKKRKKNVDTISRFRTIMLLGTFARKLKNKIDVSNNISDSDSDSESSVAEKRDLRAENISVKSISSDIHFEGLTTPTNKRKNDAFGKLRTTVLAAKFAKKLRFRIDPSLLSPKREASGKDDEDNEDDDSSSSSDVTPSEEFLIPTIRRKKNAFKNLRTAVLAGKFASKLRSKTHLKSSQLLQERINEEDDEDDSSSSSSSDIFHEESITSTKKPKRDAFSKLRTSVLAAKFGNKLRSKIDSKS